MLRGDIIKINKKIREKLFVTLGQENISWMEHKKHKLLKKINKSYFLKMKGKPQNRKEQMQNFLNKWSLFKVCKEFLQLNKKTKRKEN